MHRLVKTLVLTLVSLMFLCCGQCFAEYKYVAYYSKEGMSCIRAPLNWKQFYPGVVGNSTVLIDLKSSDQKASVLMMYENAYLPYNSLDEVPEINIESMVLNDVTQMKAKYPSTVVLDVDTKLRVKDVRYVSYVCDATFHSGRYRYYTFKTVRDHRLHSLVIMVHEFLINQLDVAGMVNSMSFHPSYHFK